jgi:hypothetical protein
VYAIWSDVASYPETNTFTQLSRKLKSRALKSFLCCCTVERWERRMSNEKRVLIHWTHVIDADGDILAIGLDLEFSITSVLMECVGAIGRLATMATRTVRETLRKLGWIVD